MNVAYPVSVRYEHGFASVLVERPDEDGCPTMFVVEFSTRPYGIHGTIYVAPTNRDHDLACIEVGASIEKLTSFLGAITSRIDNEGPPSRYTTARGVAL